MTPAEVREAARRIVERSTREQGLPFHVEDPAVLARTARVLRAAQAEDKVQRALAPESGEGSSGG
jgi:hypothetical protein